MNPIFGSGSGCFSGCFSGFGSGGGSYQQFSVNEYKKLVHTGLGAGDGGGYIEATNLTIVKTDIDFVNKQFTVAINIRRKR